jgi:hypothetical protein
MQIVLCKRDIPSTTQTANLSILNNALPLNQIFLSAAIENSKTYILNEMTKTNLTKPKS